MAVKVNQERANKFVGATQEHVDPLGPSLHEIDKDHFRSTEVS